MAVDDRRRHRSEPQEWHFRLMNDPEYFENDKAITSTDVSFFDAEMKYLHDNGSKVLIMPDLGYDENSKSYA